MFTIQRLIFFLFLFKIGSLQNYSQHPKTVRFYRIQFLSDCRMVRYSNAIRIATSLDRFTIKMVIFFLPKWSRLVINNDRSGFQMLKRWPTFQKPDKLLGF
jgi:hypothetical protein